MKDKIKNIDKKLFLTTVVLFGFGLIMIFFCFKCNSILSRSKSKLLFYKAISYHINFIFSMCDFWYANKKQKITKDMHG